jgi:hypothetical protein
MTMLNTEVEALDPVDLRQLLNPVHRQVEEGYVPILRTRRTFDGDASFAARCQSPSLPP